MRVPASIGLMVLLASLVSCEQRNYARCIPNNSDYQCASPQFCQAIEGNANLGVCVDSECTAQPLGTPNGCKADKPICSSAGHCTACTSNSQCAAISTTLTACAFPDGSPTAGICAECGVDHDCVAANPLTTKPACDKTTHTCRACAKHSECASGVCAKDNTLSNLAKNPISLGMCATADQVTVVDDATCPTVNSCPLQAKVSAASADKPYVLVKTYGGGSGATLTVNPIAGLPEQHLIASTGDLGPTQLGANTLPKAQLSTGNSLTVNAGASITVEGFLIQNNITGVVCNGNSATPTSIKLLRTIISTSNLAVQTSAMCQLTLDQSWIGTPPNTTMPNGNYEALNLDSTQFEIVNTVFDQNRKKDFTYGAITLTDNGAPGNLLGRIVNSTFYQHEGVSAGIPALAVYCKATPKALSIFNTLFVNKNAIAGKPYVDANCIKNGNVIGNYATDEQTTPIGTNVVTGFTNAIFTSADGAVLSLLPTASPKTLITGGVRTFASPSPLSSMGPAVDIEGTPRGAVSVSIGAFEVPH